MKTILQKSFLSLNLPPALPAAKRTVLFEVRKSYDFLASQNYRKLRLHCTNVYFKNEYFNILKYTFLKANSVNVLQLFFIKADR